MERQHVRLAFGPDELPRGAVKGQGKGAARDRGCDAPLCQIGSRNMGTRAFRGS